MDHHTLWQAISGITGFSFFLIANFTKFLASYLVLAGVIQLGVNTFVFLTWLQAFFYRSGFGKFVAFWGVVVPVIMASITLVRVLIPALLKSLRGERGSL